MTGIASRVLGAVGQRARALPPSAARPGLDRGARHAGAGGAQLPEPVGRAAARTGRGGEALSARDDILGGIRRGLRRGPLPAETSGGAGGAYRRASPQPHAGARRRARRRGADRPVCRDGRGGADDRRPRRLGGGHPGRGGALSGGREPAGRTGHGARSGARRRSRGTSGRCCASAADAPSRATRCR